MTFKSFDQLNLADKEAMRRQCSEWGKRRATERDKRSQETFVERFWARVDKTNSCWLWTGNTTEHGYGRACRDGEHFGAHRIAWELAYGPPGKFNVLHRCDNPPCVNPKHLFLGTQTDNMKDKSAKGREPLGSRRAMAKLTDNAVRSIRKDYIPNKVSQSMLAKKYGVSRSAIRCVLSRRTWKHVKQ